MNAEQRIRELGLSLPPARPPAFCYVPCKEHQGILYVSGQLPWDHQGGLYRGRVSSEVNIELARKAAQYCILNALAHMRSYLGSLNRVQQILKVTGFVQSDTEFVDQPAVIDAASELLLAVFGPAGAHTRTAVGVASLPRNAAVEIEVVAAIQ